MQKRDRGKQILQYWTQTFSVPQTFSVSPTFSVPQTFSVYFCQITMTIKKDSKTLDIFIKESYKEGK